MDWILFITSFFLAALSPGLNMLMALTIGLSAGYKRAFLFILSSTVCIAAIVFLSGGIIKNLTQKTEYKFEPIPEFMQELVRSGGLINYAKKSLN